jgi:hypothetical protein
MPTGEAYFKIEGAGSLNMADSNRIFKMNSFLRRFWLKHYGLQEITCERCGKRIVLGSIVLRHRVTLNAVRFYHEKCYESLFLDL